mmetsp:Transcript_26236/g.22998  ORF Transcript_26236/g.22998 Transcript_26236/m.22998 type:complete len:284 (+) Transcript_26236:98-949(+)|eukprot:CAMPEP_0201579880 /NCGR_PEP_ID=MMETSP0190_2-20130828/27776_1 /ASSEMBLY_ACC=CAM_ASM_000263 /TAXON_ID=37353 /ORGANISM="Rosalina sp." /LENGTH=283 /DNA_ID=CAMNT_0048014959 /DNA_START=98 /DNA_END=949 /DNA_ORIENTATION=+
MADEQIKDTQSDPLPPLENIYFLMVKVCGAKDLDRADFGGKSDPFCKVIANKQSWQTKHIMDNLNPRWDEETSFCFFSKIDEIDFVVFDWDKGSKHDEIGKCKLDTSAFYAAESKGFSGSIDLSLKKKKLGCIEVVVTGRMVKPKELEQRCVTLEAQSKQQQDVISKKEAECQSLMAKNAEYTSKKNTLLENQQKLNNQLSGLRDQIAAQKKRNQAKSTEIDELRQRKQKLNDDISEQQGKLEKKRNDLKREKQKLEDADKEYETAQQEATDYRENLNQDYDQ